VGGAWRSPAWQPPCSPFWHAPASRRPCTAALHDSASPLLAILLAAWLSPCGIWFAALAPGTIVLPAPGPGLLSKGSSAAESAAEDPAKFRASWSQWINGRPSVLAGVPHRALLDVAVWHLHLPLLLPGFPLHHHLPPRGCVRCCCYCCPCCTSVLLILLQYSVFSWLVLMGCGVAICAGSPNEPCCCQLWLAARSQSHWLLPWSHLHRGAAQPSAA
jgi:hypothetical protein